MGKQGLTARHMRFIGLGSAIGVGLFLGSGAAIAKAGPALLAVYAVAGITTFLMARALGELMLGDPAEGGFSTYARKLIGARTAFMVGWTYWLILLLGGAAELTAAGIFLRYWYPDLPQWVSALVGAIGLCTLNLLAVRIYGELEYWFALIKVTAILVMLTAGLAILLFGWGHGTDAASVANLWQHGGFMPNGWTGVLDSLPYSLAAFGGVELIALTAAEAEDPARSIPSAVNGLIVRILVFYLGTIAILVMLYPWRSLDATRSPFVRVLEQVGFAGAGSIMNLVVITALLSSCNSNLFGSSRMLHALATASDAPAFLNERNANGVPANCVITGAGILLGLITLNYVVPAKAFAYLLSAISFLYLWVWAVILACHLRYRASGASAPFRLPGHPVTNVVAMLILLGAAAAMALNPSTRPVYVAVACWFSILWVVRGTIKRI